MLSVLRKVCIATVVTVKVINAINSLLPFILFSIFLFFLHCTAPSMFFSAHYYDPLSPSFLLLADTFTAVPSCLSLWTCYLVANLTASHCQLLPLILPHGHSKICSCGFLFHLLRGHICLATFLDSTPGGLLRIPYDHQCSDSSCGPPHRAVATQNLGPLISARLSSQQMREQVSIDSQVPSSSCTRK